MNPPTTPYTTAARPQLTATVALWLSMEKIPWNGWLSQSPAPTSASTMPLLRLASSNTSTIASTISPTTTDVISETIRATPQRPRLAATPAFARALPALPRNRPERCAMVAMGGRYPDQRSPQPGSPGGRSLTGSGMRLALRGLASRVSAGGRRLAGVLRRLAHGPGGGAQSAHRGADALLRAAESVLRRAALPRAGGLGAGCRGLGPLLVALSRGSGLLRRRRPVCLGLLCHMASF